MLRAARRTFDSTGAGQGQEGAERKAEGPAGTDEGLQREDGRQEGRRAQEGHELLPQGRGPGRLGQAEGAAAENEGLQQAGRRQEDEGRRAQELHELLPEGLKRGADVQRAVAGLLLACTAPVFAACAAAQYPNRPLRLVVR